MNRRRILGGANANAVLGATVARGSFGATWYVLNPGGDKIDNG
jgi:hypothetical protein